jgi:hypothetical protein
MFRRIQIKVGSVVALRQFSDSILGTGNFSADFVRELRQDMAEMERERKGLPRDTFANAVLNGDLNHMESPESDEKHKRKIDRAAADLFSRLPMPADPMKAALAKSHEEMNAIDDLDALKEQVRERYRRGNRMRRTESQRIDAAMNEVSTGSHRMMRTGPGIDELVDVDRRAPAEKREDELQAEIAAMKRKVAELESALNAKQQNSSPNTQPKPSE